MTTKTPPRLLTAAEVGACIRQFRQLRHWSQEQLAEISGLNVRTVQRVEQGDSASFDTRRALARAFDFNDIDALTSLSRCRQTRNCRRRKRSLSATTSPWRCPRLLLGASWPA